MASSTDVEIVLIFGNTAIVLAVEVEDWPGTRFNIKKMMLLLEQANFGQS